jgi:hydroxyethylthiazole kinase-like uncharacterized protein yjeF
MAALEPSEVMYANAILNIDEMYRADALAMEAGVPGLQLMESAGQGIADAIQEHWLSCPVTVLCGPGNNGGDGFVVARLLSEAGWPVKLALLGNADALKGDAAANARRWNGEILPLGLDALEGTELVVDALFGAGLTRPIEGITAEVIEAIDARWISCVAVDVPSGIHGDTGQVMGVAAHAALTISFFRPKPAHLLMPGREYCGDVEIVDIGIPESVLDEIAPTTHVNGPDLWAGRFPWPEASAHKYSRGHAIIAGGAVMTGAAQLAAGAARRTGAGLVTIATPPAAFDIYASSQPGNLVKSVVDRHAFANVLTDPRINACLIGPGIGIGEATRARVSAALATGRACVIDADAISSFAADPQTLFGTIKGPCVLTPHEGEFKRLFGDVDSSVGRLERARAAARRSGAVVLLKGADTVVAKPDGEAVINATGTPFLATAGSGDVLAGMVVALMAQGMVPFDAAATAAWLHGTAAESFGPGLIAEDLVDGIPEALDDLLDWE